MLLAFLECLEYVPLCFLCITNETDLSVIAQKDYVPTHLKIHSTHSLITFKGVVILSFCNQIYNFQCEISLYIKK